MAVRTEWDEFVALDYRRIYGGMLKPAYLFDGRRILDHAALSDMGFCVQIIGTKCDNLAAIV